MKLSDSLAAGRHIYSTTVPTLPDIVVIDVPPDFAAPSLPLGRYYPIIVETALERLELEHFLDLPRSRLIAPALLDRRSSHGQGTEIKLCHYDAADAGWPFILLCQWPTSCTNLVSSSPNMLARGAYTIEMFPTALERAEETLKLWASLCEYGLSTTVVTC
ncbi:MAG: hypothetical protein C0494_05870 [Sphingobium sp.]|nr:hypothetical protein [Sphingobium sp.]